MFDYRYYSYDYNFWKYLKHIKVINFSRNFHEKLIAMGLHSIYLQYFIQPQVSIQSGDVSKVFFWQRNTELNIHNVAKIFENQDISLFLHTAIDPNHYFISPTLEQEKKLNISYSEWFDNKSDLLDLIASCGIYIAPRMVEGIGMGFIEALAMGKLVIAHDAPTMNEYIINNKNGLLVDMSNLSTIDWDNIPIEKIQKNAYEFCKNGCNNWIIERKQIINFIDLPYQKYKRIIRKLILKSLPKKIIKNILPYGIVELLFKRMS